MSPGGRGSSSERVERVDRRGSFGVLRLCPAQKDAPDFAQDDKLEGVGCATALGDFRNRFKPGKVQQAGLRRRNDAQSATSVVKGSFQSGQSALEVCAFYV